MLVPSNSDAVHDSDVEDIERAKNLVPPQISPRVQDIQSKRVPARGTLCRKRNHAQAFLNYGRSPLNDPVERFSEYFDLNPRPICDSRKVPIRNICDCTLRGLRSPTPGKRQRLYPQPVYLLLLARPARRIGNCGGRYGPRTTHYWAYTTTYPIKARELCANKLKVVHIATQVSYRFEETQLSTLFSSHWSVSENLTSGINHAFGPLHRLVNLVSSRGSVLSNNLIREFFSRQHRI